MMNELILIMSIRLPETPKHIFSRPFWPIEWNYGDTLTMISFIIGIISLIYSIVINAKSNKTLEKLANDAATKALEKVQSASCTDIVPKYSTNDLFDGKKQENVRKLVKKIIREAKKNSPNNPWVHAIVFPIQLQSELTEDQTVKKMLYWKEKGYIEWTSSLESSTKVYIKVEGAKIIEDIGSC